MTAPWPATPPEGNYLLLARGAGEATTVASGAAWQAQTLESLTHAEMSQLNTAVTATSWIGASGTASAASASLMNGVLGALSGWSQSTVPITEAAAMAYRAAVSSMFPDVVCTENRDEQAKDVAINPWVWGALTPDIARLDGTYFGVYWTENATQGLTYSALLTSFLSTLGIPPPVGPLSVSPAAPAAAAEQIASATADGAVGDAMRESTSAGMQITDQMGSAAGSMGSAQTLMEPVMAAAQAPMQAGQSLGSSVSSPLQSVTSPLQSVMGMFSMAGAGGPGAGAAVPPGGAAADAIGPAATAGESAGVAGGAGLGGTGVGGYAAAAAGSSYTRPTSSFSTESGGAASYAKPGAARLGAAAAPVTGSPMAPVGMLRPNTAQSEKQNETKTVHLRIRSE